MAAEATRTAPAWDVVIDAEARKITLALRPLIRYGPVVLLLAGASVLYLHRVAGETIHWTLLALPLALLAGVTTARTWYQNNVDQRAYHWTLPVERSRGHLAILASGWLWMILIVSVYLGWAAFLYRLTGSAGAANTPVRELFLPLPSAPQNFAVNYATATFVYLVVSVPSIFARRASLWFTWVWIGFYFPYMYLRSSEGPFARFIAEEVFGRGRLGLTTAITGQSRGAGQTAVVDAALWGPAIGVWMAVALFAVLIVAHVHREA